MSGGKTHPPEPVFGPVTYWSRDSKPPDPAMTEQVIAALAEACRRMGEQEHRTAGYHLQDAAYWERCGWRTLEAASRGWAAEREGIAGVYDWYALRLAGGSICTCRLPRYCPSPHRQAPAAP